MAVFLFSPMGIQATATLAILFHTPYCKLVQKSVGRLALHDFVSADPAERGARYPGLEKFADTRLETSYFDREVEKAFMGHSAKIFETKTKPSLHLATNVGNMFTPSVYGGLVSYYTSPILHYLDQDDEEKMNQVLKKSENVCQL